MSLRVCHGFGRYRKSGDFRVRNGFLQDGDAAPQNDALVVYHHDGRLGGRLLRSVQELGDIHA